MKTPLDTLSPAQVRELLQNLERMPVDEQLALLEELDALEERQRLRACRDDFLTFCHTMYEGFKEGPHHRHLKPLLHDVKDGTQLRVTVSMPPRFGKSETISYLYAAWFLGHYPKYNIIMCTHTASLSSAFGRKIRNLIGTPMYQKVFPDTIVSADKSAADDWTTTAGGSYLAVGVGANIAGRGAHLCLIDDAVSEQVVLGGNPDTAFQMAFDWLQVGPMQRLAPNGRILMIATRWGRKDPIGRALSWAEENPGSIPWHEVRFPAILPSGKSLWPEQWSVEELLAKKASMMPQYWAAQYLQEPTSEEGALLKREWWKVWTKETPPQCDFVIQSWDTAHETSNAHDFSACTTWGVWRDEEDGKNKIILLNAFRARLEFPQLKARVLAEYREWKPDCLLIEKKAAGAPLIQELRQMDIVVQEVTPTRGTATQSNDKRARLNAVSGILFSGLVYHPDLRWAHEVIEECASFPHAEHDDLCDTTVQAWARFRQGGFLRMEGDAEDDEDNNRMHRRRHGGYY